MNPQPTLRVLTATDPHALALSIRASCLVFEDAKSKGLLKRVQRIAPSEATALVIGETGTGKELIARHIHELSERRQHPFVAVNCAAISESLIESELFGHERGAFTGAVTARPRMVRNGSRRHVVPGRDRRSASAASGEIAARRPGARSGAGRLASACWY